MQFTTEHSHSMKSELLYGTVLLLGAYSHVKCKSLWPGKNTKTINKIRIHETVITNTQINCVHECSLQDHTYLIQCAVVLFTE